MPFLSRLALAEPFETWPGMGQKGGHAEQKGEHAEQKGEHAEQKGEHAEQKGEHKVRPYIRPNILPRRGEPCVRPPMFDG